LACLLDGGIHHVICNSYGTSIVDNCLSNADWTGTRLLVERGVNINFPKATLRNCQQARYSSRFLHPESATLQKPFAAPMQLATELPTLPPAFKQAYEGTLEAIPEDCNWTNVNGMSLLMCAAAGGQTKLVTRLLERRARVNARSTENCTPLCFATDCTDEGVECMRVLLEARANVNVRSGVAVNTLNSATGTNNPVGCSVASTCNHERLALLLEYGYDATATNDYGLSPLFFAAISRPKPGKMDFINTLLEHRCSFDADLHTRPGRTTLQKPFGAIRFVERNTADPPTLACLLSVQYHTCADTFKLMYKEKLNTVHESPFLEALGLMQCAHEQLTAVTKHPASINGDYSLLEWALQAGLDLTLPRYRGLAKGQLLQRIIVPKDAQLRNGEIMPIVIVLMDYYNTSTRFFHICFNHVMKGVDLTKGHWPKWIRMLYHYNKATGRSSLFAQAWADYMLARSLEQ